MIFRFKFEPRDLWIGIYWTREVTFSIFAVRVLTKVYICLVPTLCIKLAWEKKKAPSFCILETKTFHTTGGHNFQSIPKDNNVTFIPHKH